ncbi:Crossover junction endonuclease [Lachnellula occidentalis]|uniref:Crossover junction endonuclease MUS81 n=1 Tax=Lachnellula occidentalis TaxID=215460 RepID=A0A8H8UJE2_9HELO|nr:Crossover junction endonuclease [Lachnellula occidentalis]
MADECANPLLLGWVKEWLDQARDRNSKGATVYKKAYNSLNSCPLPFTHPSEAKQLTGFGDKLCQRLTDKLKEHCEENGLPMPQIPKKKRKRPANADPSEDDDGEGDEDAERAPAKKPKKPKAYVPKVRSGGYGIILALSTLDESSRSGVTKQEVIELAQPHCDASYTAPSDTTKFYTAWKSMDTLNKNDMVYKKGKPEKYYLTDEGWDIAKRMRNTISGNVDNVSPSKAKKTYSKAAALTPSPSKPSKPSKPKAPLSAAAAAGAAALARDSHNNGSFLSLDSSPVCGPAPSPSVSPTKANLPSIIADGQPIESASSLPEFTPIALPADSFTVNLVLDIREVRSKKDREGIQNELISNGVNPIMRALELGDILWVAKMKDPNLLTRLGAEGDEVVLDWIVERKRLDDLIASIKDGRFHDQKFRLRKSGLKNVIYLIEEFSLSAENSDRYSEAVQSAIASTQVVNGYFVKQTQHLTDSVLYLARMTKMLKGLYENKPLQVIPTKVITTHNYLPLLAHLRETKPAEEFHTTYSAFASLSSKSDALTLKDVFLKMLMCIKGVTGEKALEIQKRWKTPNELLEAYEKCGEGEQGRKKKMEMVSSQMSDVVGKKKIHKAVSVKIAEVWGDVKTD